MNRRFLAVGINKFLMPGNNLQCCVQDCHTMMAVAESMGISADALTDQTATKANIIGWLEGAVAQAKAGELSYIGYSHSGHGTHYNRADGSLAEAIVPYDLVEKNGDWYLPTLFTEDEFRNLFNQIPLSCTAEIFGDLCFSQGLARVFGGRSIHNPANIENVFRMADPNAKLQAGLNPNIILWSACSADETAADAPYLKNGAFTHSWEWAYQQDMKASRLEILLRTKAEIKRCGFNQTPHLNAFNVKVQLPIGA
jgi:hypothetical protein